MDVEVKVRVGKPDGSVGVPCGVCAGELVERVACAQVCNCVHKILGPLGSEGVVESPCLGNGSLAKTTISVNYAKTKTPNSYG